jgi:acetyl esterase/lipase
VAITTTRPVVLEAASQEFVDATSTPPFIYELTSDEARKVLDDVQAEPIDKLPVAERWITVPAKVGDVRARIVRPPDADGTLPAILYMHGGGMTAALALMANERGDVQFVQQSMYYPVTDAGMDTGSYEQFAEGYFLAAKGMAWFWDQYLPDIERRSEPYASPLRARDEQLAGLPPAFVIVDEADVLRDEGEAYAARLRSAGVAVTTVRYDGITHDFMMLNPLSNTHATRAAVAQAISVLRDALWRIRP